MNIFIINAHKFYSYSKGELNKFLFNTIKSYYELGNDVKTTIIEQGYDVNEEIEKYKWADVIFFQSPVNWYSVPYSFKQYIDEVYRGGDFYIKAERYGRGGKLTDKKYMLSLTSAASIQEYISTDGFFNIRSIDDIFISFHKTHEYCGMKKLDTFVVYDVFHNLETEKIKMDLINHLTKLSNKL